LERVEADNPVARAGGLVDRAVAVGAGLLDLEVGERRLGEAAPCLLDAGGVGDAVRVDVAEPVRGAFVELPAEGGYVVSSLFTVCPPWV
jgi:hypothetical protein